VSVSKKNSGSFGIDFIPPNGINTVAAAKCIPDTPKMSCDPVKIIDAHPNTLFVIFSTMNTTCPIFPYLILMISSDV
jgi:hypothetical protein